MVNQLIFVTQKDTLTIADYNFFAVELHGRTESLQVSRSLVIAIISSGHDKSGSGNRESGVKLPCTQTFLSTLLNVTLTLMIAIRNEFS